MTVKNILCAYTGDPGRGAGLAHAVRLARQGGAWLTGVPRHVRPRLDQQITGNIPSSLLSTLKAVDQARFAEVRALFDRAMAAHGLTERSDFVDLEQDHGLTLAEFARSFDLLVMGGHADMMDDAHMNAHPDLVALRSGRPVVVVPPGFEAEAPAAHAVLAWDGKRSAARALGDAMPVLEEKATVTVLTVGARALPGTDTLMKNLDRHGIRAALQVAPREKSVASTILNVARDRGAKLIVMGAYEHSKFSHDLWGGVTTDVIRETDVPVFMSH